MPGKKVLTLPAGDFDVYYEIQAKTEGDEIFEPPEGVRVKVEGVGRAPLAVLVRRLRGRVKLRFRRLRWTLGQAHPRVACTM